MGGLSVESEPDKPLDRRLLDVVAGGLAGAVSRITVGPLDVVKIRMQVQLEPVRSGARSKYTGVVQALKTIFREEGAIGLWRGTAPALLLTVPYTAVQFMVLQCCKNELKARGLDRTRFATAGSFVSGALAGAAATVASYPFDLLRTVLAAQGEPKLYQGVGHAASGIVKARGLRGLYAGVGITLVEIMPYAAITFGTYDMMVTALATRRAEAGGEELSLRGRMVQQFCCGLVAGMAGKCCTHPLDVAKKRYQVSGLTRSLAYGARVDPSMTSSLRHCLHQIHRTEGLAGFFKGLTPSLIKAAPASAVTFACYEFFVGYLAATLVT